MNFFAKLIEFFNTSGEVPKAYGAFHLAFFIGSIVLGVILALINRKGNEKFTRILLLATGIIVILLEIYKQITFSYSVVDGNVVADYQWYIFPFQFCSTPMLVSVVAALVKNGKVHRALCAYLATFAVFAGLAVMVYPGDVFIATVGINYQTMICHGSMITIGIYLFGSGYVKAQHKTILRAAPVFAVFTAIAAVLNEVMFYSGILGGETFNAFYISRHFDPHLPVYKDIQAVLPFALELIVYIIGFTAAAYVILLIAMLIRKLIKRK